MYYLPSPRAVNKKWLGKDRDRKGWMKETRGRKRRWGELKLNLGTGCTHRGGWAIGPGSTPPSFVLTPAAFPPVRLVPFTFSLPAASVVVHIWWEVPWIITFSCSVWLPVPISTLIQPSVSLAVPSIKWSMFRWAIVIAATEQVDKCIHCKLKTEQTNNNNKVVPLNIFDITHKTWRYTSLSVHSFLPVCAPVPFCHGLFLCHYWRSL